MSALPRPDLPPGAHRDLVEALHELHHRAGWPSLRTLAAAAACSHTTVSKVFSSPALPAWGIVELLVEAMSGDVDEFHHLWLASSAPADAVTSPRLAGRRTELAAVRRHLEVGTGLLVVTGEAGMGKSRLVTAAMEAVGAPVAFGACLPLSQSVPLMPVADALVSASAADHGQRVDELLARGPAYLRPALARLMPELDDGSGSGTDQRQVFLAVARLLAARLPLVLDDLHWADPGTLDLLEHLVASRAPVTLVGTWRLDDSTLPEPTRDWWQRMRRLPAASTMTLPPLDRLETAEQIEELGVAPEAGLVDRVYARSGGRPLFTEQLAAHGGDELPDVLADLLDRRLSELGPDAQVVAVRLGVADRPMPIGLLAELTLSGERLDEALHELRDRYLLASSSAGVSLRHPLLAEAARQRLLPHQRQTAHRRVAELLSASATGDAAEIAEHWRAAGESSAELTWRERAARAADARGSQGQAANEWLRVLELWPADGSKSSVEHADALIEAMRCLGSSARIEHARELIEPALSLVHDVDPGRAAQLYLWSAEVTGALLSIEQSIPLFEKALEQQNRLHPSANLVRIMSRMSGHLRGEGAYARAAGLVQRAVEVSAGLGDPVLLRSQLQMRAFDETMAGQLARAEATTREAEAIDTGTARSDPVWEGVLRTDMLLLAGGTVEEFRAVAEPALEFIRSEEIESFPACLLQSNFAQALVRAGLVTEAARLIDPMTVAATTGVDHWPLFIERARLDSIRGEHDRASTVVTLVDAIPITSVANRAERAERCAVVELWRGDPEAAWARLMSALAVLRDTEASGHAGGLLVLAARAAADRAGGRADADAARVLVRLRESLHRDPLADDGVAAVHAAMVAQWGAELGRLVGRSDPGSWAGAAKEWDTWTHPHDAAYCRWRGAQAALVTGQGTVAGRLLKQAGRDAREHVPLSRAIAETAGYAHHS